jgi:hypothetical protein
MRSAGRMARMGEKRCLQSIGGTPEGRRPLGGIPLLCKELLVSKQLICSLLVADVLGG